MSGNAVIALREIADAIEQERQVVQALQESHAKLLDALRRLWAWQGTVQELVPDDLANDVQAAIAAATKGE